MPRVSKISILVTFTGSFINSILSFCLISSGIFITVGGLVLGLFQYGLPQTPQNFGLSLCGCQRLSHRLQYLVGLGNFLIIIFLYMCLKPYKACHLEPLKMLLI